MPLSTRPDRASGRPWLQRLGSSEALTGYFLISPAVFLMTVLLAYPSSWLSGSASRPDPGEPGKFVGLGNFLKLLQDSLFARRLELLRLHDLHRRPEDGPGHHPALILNQRCGSAISSGGPAAALDRTYLPECAHLALMFDSLFSVVNYILLASGHLQEDPLAGDPFWPWCRWSPSTPGGACPSSPSRSWPA